MPSLELTTWVVFDPEGRVLIDTREFLSESDCWRIVLGWPSPEEIESAKREGYRVVRANVKITTPDENV